MPTRPVSQTNWLVERAISHDPELRAMAARDPLTPVGYLRRLALDPDIRVASQVRLNPSRPDPLVVRAVTEADLRGRTPAEAADAVCDMDVDARCPCGDAAITLNSTGFACAACQSILDATARQAGSAVMLLWRGASGVWHPAHAWMSGDDVAARRAQPEPPPEVRLVVQ